MSLNGYFEPKYVLEIIKVLLIGGGILWAAAQWQQNRSLTDLAQDSRLIQLRSDVDASVQRGALARIDIATVKTELTNIKERIRQIEEKLERDRNK